MITTAAISKAGQILKGSGSSGGIGARSAYTVSLENSVIMTAERNAANPLLFVVFINYLRY